MASLMNTSKPSMQNVNFKNLEAFYSFLPEKELEMTLLLRRLLLKAMPDIQENLAYNVPFFKGNKNIAFLWPAAILWGKKKTYEGIRIGFTQGFRLTDPENFLEKGNRKQVYYKTFQHIKDLQKDIEQLNSFILEAVLLDKS